MLLSSMCHLNNKQELENVPQTVCHLSSTEVQSSVWVV